MADVLFVNSTQDNKLRHQINGTLLLATKLLNAGFDVKILRFFEIESYGKNDYYGFIDDMTDKILSINPKCVSFYTLWPYYHLMLRIAQRLKKANPNIITIMGGPQSSATAHATMKAMEFVDYISTGEGENTVVPFFESILKQNRSGIENIAGLYYRDGGEIKFNNVDIALCDLDALPRWDERLYNVDETGLDKDDYFMPIDVGRGCPYRCTFCATSRFWKRAYRLKSPERILDDIKFYNKKFGIKSFWFTHDAFTSNKKLVSDVCDFIIDNKLNIRWKCTTRVDRIDEELILKMKSAGLTRIEMGVETGSQRMQKLIKKNLDLKAVREKVKMVIDNKILVDIFFMYGFPEETEDDLNQTLDLMFDLKDMGVTWISMNYCHFNPATIITQTHFDELVFDPEIKVLANGVFGASEETEMMRSNKEIFTTFHHLNTPVRDNYQYTVFLVHLYNKFFNSLKFIRPFYKGDNLKFYNDFYNNNIEIFNGGISYITKNILENPVEMLANAFKGFDKSLRERICAILEFDFDLKTVKNSKEDSVVRKTYSFSYLEYQMKIPLELYTDSKTELLIEKKNQKINILILSI